jgi:hypothetical protein
MLINTIKNILLKMNRNLFIKKYLLLILKKNIDKRTAIHEAAKIGNFFMLDFFFKIINNENITNEYEQNKKALCEDFDDEFKTSLHLAAAEGKIQLNIIY